MNMFLNYQVLAIINKTTNSIAVANDNIYYLNNLNHMIGLLVIFFIIVFGCLLFAKEN